MFFFALFLSAFMLFVSCQKTEEKKVISGKDTVTVEKSTIAEESGSAMSDDGGLMELPGANYMNYPLSQYIGMGAEVILGQPKTDFAISQLITYAQDPYKIIIDASFYNPWVISDFAEKGARIVVKRWLFSDFQTKAFIDYAPQNKKDNVTVIAIGSPPQTRPTQTLEYVKMGARVKVFKWWHKPFDIINYIDAGWKLHNKALVEVYVLGFNSYWVEEFIRRGDNIYVRDWFSSFDILQFAKISKEVGKGKVRIDGKFFTENEIQRFLSYDATVILGGEMPGNSLNAFKIAELIKKNPSHVVVLGDFYQAHHIAEFIRLGAKVIFLWGSQSNSDIEAFLKKTPPPARDVLSKRNN